MKKNTVKVVLTVLKYVCTFILGLLGGEPFSSLIGAI